MNCRLCNSNSLRLYYSQGNNDQFKFYKCIKCNLVNYDLSTGLNQEKYAKNFIDPLDEYSRQNRGQTQSYNFIKKCIPLVGKLLDIGCGNGRFLYLAKKDDLYVKGIEVSPYLAKFSSDHLRVEVVAQDFLKYSNVNEKFDIIALRHVLEHLPDPVMALKKIFSLLNDNGYALLEFPNIESLNYRLKRLLSKYYIYKKRYKSDYKPGHCNEFSLKSFKYLTRITGFKILIWQTYSYKRISNYIYNYINVGNKVRTIIKKMD